jgi:hypothetical protein
MLHRNDGATFTGTVTLLRDPPSIPQLNPDFGPLIDRAGPELAEERGFSVRGPSSPPPRKQQRKSLCRRKTANVGVVGVLFLFSGLYFYSRFYYFGSIIILVSPLFPT